MISLRKLSKQFAEKILFQNANFQVGMNDKIGLIGANGSGKTTIFSLILGEQSADSGWIEKNKSMVIGCLEQEIVENLTHSLMEEIVSSCPHINRIKEHIDFLQEEIAQEKDSDKIHRYAQKLGEYQAEFESRGGYNLEYQAKRILFGLGFQETDGNRRLEEFSGGWRRRLCLAKLLLREPDLLLLDEPTNHLDLESLIWLEDFLQTYQGAVIIISHDRTFLNNVVTRVVEIDQKTLNLYTGNYDDFVKQKRSRQEILEASYKNQQKKIETTQRFIERFRYKATKARQVQSRVKSLEKMEKIHLEQYSSRFSITIPPPPRSGKIVLQIKKVSKRYGQRVVYDKLDFVLHRGDRIALVGSNGAGKSTLLKIMAGVLPIDGGEMVLGYNVFRAYFAQHQLEILNPQYTVLEEVDPYFGPDSEISPRAYLGAFLFRGDDVFKKVDILSGGEKSRLVLAKMIMEKPNLLLLDEPTNHLDIASRDCLQEALTQYSGAICMISHDRVFINHLANKIISIKDGHIETFLGNYDDYFYQMEKQQQALMISSPTEPAGKERKSKNRQQKRFEAEKRNLKYRRLNPLLQESEKVQAELNAVMKKMDHLKKLFIDPAYYQQPEFPRKLAEYKELEEKNEELTNRWTDLEEQIEAAEQKFNDEDL